MAALALSRPEKGRLFSHWLTDYSLHLYAARDYPAAHGPVLRKEDLKDHLMIGHIPDLIHTPEPDYLSGLMADPRPRFSSANLFAQMHAVEAGTGLCILPDFMVRQVATLVPVLPDVIEIRRAFWLMAHEASRDSARVQAAIRFIVEQVEHARGDFLPHFLPE